MLSVVCFPVRPPTHTLLSLPFIFSLLTSFSFHWKETSSLYAERGLWAAKVAIRLIKQTYYLRVFISFLQLKISRFLLCFYVTTSSISVQVESFSCEGGHRRAICLLWPSICLWLACKPPGASIVLELESSSENVYYDGCRWRTCLLFISSRCHYCNW